VAKESRVLLVSKESQVTQVPLGLMEQQDHLEKRVTKDCPVFLVRKEIAGQLETRE